MVNQILNAPHDLEFAGKWLSSQFGLTPKSKKVKEKIEDLKKQLAEAQKKGGGKPDPKLKKELEETKRQLNSILNKWKFGDEPIKTSEEFLNSFEPWINSQLEKQKELKAFLSKKGVKNLEELESLPETESEKLKFYQEDIKIKEEIIKDYKEQEQAWKNTENDYLRQIEELKARPEGEDNEDLITERDELARDKKTLEQENLDLDKKLKSKVKEFETKEKALERLKKESSQKEISLNKTITEIRKQLKDKDSLITTLNQEKQGLKKEIEKLKE